MSHPDQGLVGQLKRDAVGISWTHHLNLIHWPQEADGEESILGQKGGSLDIRGGGIKLDHRSLFDYQHALSRIKWGR